MGIYPPKDIDRASAPASESVPASASNANADSLASAPAPAPAPAFARICAVAPESPADDAGFEPGCAITSVDGHPLRDLIDWRWLAADDVVTLGYIDLDGDAGEVELEREQGQDWGIEFDGVIFDGVKQCRNACTFCFMRQLPRGMRPSLSLRDDDFRLSFLSGTFVTFTNLDAADEARIIEQRISPLRMSLHAIDSDVRAYLIGKHAQHGIDVLERLCAAGIEFHTQIVLVPGVNDGVELEKTLAWAYTHPSIANVGIVPLGFTKHQGYFTESFNDPLSSLRVIETIAPFQERALAERGMPWVFAADEFYRNAYGENLLEKLPPASHYGDFSLFEDGIGIIRSYVDDWHASCALQNDAACALRAANARACFIVGGAMQPFLGQLIRKSPLNGLLSPLVVRNDFFGGNVDVTGLLCGCDIAGAVARCQSEFSARAKAEPVALARAKAESPAQECAASAPTRAAFFVPRVIFNDDGVTLDDMSLEDMEKAAGARLHVVSCNPSDFLPEIAAFARSLCQ